jgi:hypothetical protein
MASPNNITVIPDTASRFSRSGRAPQHRAVPPRLPQRLRNQLPAGGDSHGVAHHQEPLPGALPRRTATRRRQVRRAHIQASRSSTLVHGPPSGMLAPCPPGSGEGLKCGLHHGVDLRGKAHRPVIGRTMSGYRQYRSVTYREQWMVNIPRQSVERRSRASWIRRYESSKIRGIVAAISSGVASASG